MQRQYSSSLYERLLLSSDKNKVMELSTQGLVVQKPEDIVKDPKGGVAARFFMGSNHMSKSVLAPILQL